jgi:4-amino-4-deoxy-L-arabinose transferase-like glycosyltransferase
MIGRLRPELGLLAAAALLLLSGLGATDLWAPDEPRYAQVAEELRRLEHGARSLVLLHLNGEAYTQKPPLYFWLAAAAGAPGGHVSERAARLPSALAGLALCALVLALGRRLFDRATALLAAALLLTTGEFLWLARRAQLDVLLAVFETAALLAFWRLERGEVGRRAGLAGLHGWLGLAVLTKGPVGWLVPMLVIGSWLATRRRLRELPRALPPWGLALSLGPGLLWLGLAAGVAPPGWFGEAVGTNLLGRFFAGTSHARPFYYYLYRLPLDFLPWTALWPLVWRSARRRVFHRAPDGSADPAAPAWSFLLVWLAASVAFFSLSTGKRGLYLLPAFPALALLCADALRRALEGRATLPRALSVGAGCLAALLGLAGGTAVLAPLAPPSGVNPARLALGGGAMLAALAAGALVLLVAARRGAPLRIRLGVCLAALGAAELALLVGALPAFDPAKSARPIAESVIRLCGPAPRLGLVGNAALTGGLVYYGVGRVVPLPTPESVEHFVREGGCAIAVRERQLDRVTAAVPVRVHERLREGRRALLLLAPEAPGPAAAAALPPGAAAHRGGTRAVRTEEARLP